MNNQKTFAAYFTGFSLCLLLTVVAFTLTGMKLLNDMTLYLALSGLAILQFTVQSICFLGLNNKSNESRLQLLPYLFMLVIVFILVGGTIWIMQNLNYNMAH